MSRSLNFPENYYIVWLDQHIGHPDFCLQLKRAFITHINPQNEGTVSLSDKDIDHSIGLHSEIPAHIDDFPFILRAFIDEAPCLKYIDEIQHNRILFIASSLLGQPAVDKLLRRYPHSFTNSNTNKPYDSIYIFCTDMLVASQWAYPYLEYVKIFDFESDLLTRMIRDLGEEFIEQGQQLIEANQYESAFKRLSWARSLFIRYDNLSFTSEPEKIQQVTEANTTTEQNRVQNSPSVSSKQPRRTKKLIQIDKLLDIAEEQMKQQSENDSDQVSTIIATIAVFTPNIFFILSCWKKQYLAYAQNLI
jgi:hypothetical protein